MSITRVRNSDRAQRDDHARGRAHGQRSSHVLRFGARLAVSGHFRSRCVISPDLAPGAQFRHL